MMRCMHLWTKECSARLVTERCNTNALFQPLRDSEDSFGSGGARACCAQRLGPHPGTGKGDGSFFQGPHCVAACGSHDACDLQTYRLFSFVGAIWTHEPAPPCRGFGSEQYCRRIRPRDARGIFAVPRPCQGLELRSGNTDRDRALARLREGRESDQRRGIVRGGEPLVERADERTPVLVPQSLRPFVPIANPGGPCEKTYSRNPVRAIHATPYDRVPSSLCPLSLLSTGLRAARSNKTTSLSLHPARYERVPSSLVPRPCCQLESER